jgi:threonine 3-dehydrogenase
MKALSKLKAEEGIWMTDVPEPEVGHNDLLIKIRKTAICGTDVHIYNWDEWSQKTIPVPMVVGHEYVGEVVGIGQEVRGFKIGDRVPAKGISPAATAVTAARAYASVPQHHRRGRQPSGLLC